MLRVFLFVIVVFALGLGFAWLADRPGDLILTFNGYQYQVSLMVAAVAVVVVVAAVMILWWLLKSIWTGPSRLSRYFRVRRRDRGYQALSTGMIAAGSGDAFTARRMNRQAAKLISADQEPLLHLLDVQTLLLEGDRERARGKFETMLDDPALKPLALHGLFLEARRRGDKEAARHYAIEASRTAPQLGWASGAAVEEKAEAGEWDEALKLIDGQRAAAGVDRDRIARRRAVILAAKADSVLDRDPAAAKNAALEANRLAPDLVPAAVTAAKALFRQDDLRRGSKILEAAWKRQPHPEIAEAYVHARPGDSTGDRLARARKLAGLRSNNAESALAMARAALDAGDFAQARDQADAAIRLRPSEGAYLVRADVEEAETGDQGRVRFWLQKAVRAPRDSAWTADGFVSERWLPLSPVSGKIDAFEWKEPAERLGPAIEQEEREDLPAIAVHTPLETAASSVAYEPADEAVAESAAVADAAAEAEPATAPISTPPDSLAKNPTASRELASTAAQEELVRREDGGVPDERTPALPPTPDDPGVDRSEPPSDQSRRFRLF